jgi:hypothetical protein
VLVVVPWLVLLVLVLLVCWLACRRPPACCAPPRSLTSFFFGIDLDLDLAAGRGRREANQRPGSPAAAADSVQVCSEEMGVRIEDSFDEIMPASCRSFWINMGLGSESSRERGAKP